MIKLLLLALIMGPVSIYSLSFRDTNGHLIHLSDFRGKKILFVNTASSGPYVKQYASLEQLYQQNKDSLVIIAFPSNDFGNEPDSSNQHIQTSVYGQFNIHFILASRISVRGSGQDSLYQWLTNSDKNGVKTNDAQSDFYKYLVDGSGNWIGVFSGMVDPMSKEMLDAIKN